MQSFLLGYTETGGRKVSGLHLGVTMKRRQLIHNATSQIDRRRELRRNSTRAEALLWASLRRSQVDGKRFRRQHGIGPYIVDFYCPECRVIVELDGAVHERILAGERDARRSEFLAKLGMEVLRFENEEVFKNRERVVESIRAALKERLRIGRG